MGHALGWVAWMIFEVLCGSVYLDSFVYDNVSTGTIHSLRNLFLSFLFSSKFRMTLEISKNTLLT